MNKLREGNRLLDVVRMRRGVEKIAIGVTRFEEQFFAKDL